MEFEPNQNNLFSLSSFVLPKWNPALKMCKYVWPDIRPVVWTGEEYRLREAWFTCSRTVPQWCEFEKSRPTSIEQLEKQAVDDGKWRRARWSTLVSHGGEWTYIFQPIGNALVYCYWISNVVFVNLTTAVASWTVCTRIFMQDTSLGKPSKTASSLGSWAQSLAGWLSLSFIFRLIMLQFVGPWWLRSY